MNTKQAFASCIVCALIAVPTVSMAKARGGGGGYSSGSRSGSGSVGSRGTRTYEPNAAKPIEQSTAPKPATAPAPTAGSQAPAVQANPSLLQRHPVLSGIAAGLAGSWIGHMLFGATDSSAKTGEGEEIAGVNSKPGFSMTDLLLLMLVAGGVLYVVLRGRRTPAPVLTGMSRRGAAGGSWLEAAPPSRLRAAAGDAEVNATDKSAFQALLIEIQTAWSKQDLAALRRSVTPEMLSYFSAALSEQASQDLENHVEDVVLTEAEVQEAWTEDATQYATAKLRWTARDYTLSLKQQPGEPDHVVEGSKETPAETTEVWTFMRHQQGKWLLSAIQQVA